MNLRKTVNFVLQKNGYQLVKVFPSGDNQHFLPAQVIDNSCLAARVAPKRKHAWIVAAPKSGSTWLSKLLEHLLGWPSVPLLNGHDRREQEVDIRPILPYPDVNILSPHQHCRASKPTIDFIKNFRVTPIILTRSVADTVISLRDHLLNESLAWPMAYVDEKFLQLNEDQQYQFIIEMFLPWYFNFYASWLRVEGMSPSDLIFIRYEDLVADTKGTLKKVLAFLKETRSEAEIDAVINRVGNKGTRLNKGVSGRGERLLNERHMKRIQELRDYYSHIDFSMVGL